jgi:hypothetical protein
MNEPNSIPETLTGGRNLTVTLEGGKTCEVFVRQLPVKDYPAAQTKRADEMAFMSFVCQQSPQWPAMLTPESYDDVQQAVTEANPRFFGWLQRQTEAAWSTLPAEVRRQAAESLFANLLPTTPRSTASRLPMPRG